MDFKIGIELISFAGQQRLELLPCDILLERLERILGLEDDGVVLLGFAEFDHPNLIFEFTVGLADAGELRLERGPLLHQLLRFLRIVPEVRVFSEGVQFGETCRGGIDVKDASSAARQTA